MIGRTVEQGLREWLTTKEDWEFNSQSQHTNCNKIIENEVLILLSNSIS